MNEELIQAVVDGIVPEVRAFLAASIEAVAGPLRAEIAELSGSVVYLRGLAVTAAADLQDLREPKELDPETIVGPLRGEVAGLRKELDMLNGVATLLTDKAIGADDVAPMIAAEVEKRVAAIPAPQDGKDLDPIIVAELVRHAVDDAVAALPVPKDGTSITVDQLAPLVSETVAKAIAGITLPAAKDGRGIASAVIDAEGKLTLRYSDGEEVALGVVVGKSADPMAILKQVTDNLPPPQHGRDGIATRDELNTLVDAKVDAKVSAAVASEVEKAVALLPRIEYKGVFRQGETYTKGNGATFGNEMWMCLADETTQTPGTGKDWQLAVRKGRDGNRGTKV